jgi:hypothetical protein
MTNNTCTHPPTRLFSWHVDGVLCVGCCECGEILRGAYVLENETDVPLIDEGESATMKHFFFVGHPDFEIHEKHEDGSESWSHSVMVPTFIEACQKAVWLVEQYGKPEDVWIQERKSGAIAEYDMLDFEDDDGEIFYAFVPLIVIDGKCRHLEIST